MPSVEGWNTVKWWYQLLIFLFPRTETEDGNEEVRRWKNKRLSDRFMEFLPFKVRSGRRKGRSWKTKSKKTRWSFR